MTTYVINLDLPGAVNPATSTGTSPSTSAAALRRVLGWRRLGHPQ